MKKKQKAFLLAALAMPFIAGATLPPSPLKGESNLTRAESATFPWLTFKMTDGSEMSVAAEGLVINYSEGSLLLKSATVDEAFATENIATMRFTAEAAAVEGIPEALATEADYFDLSGKNAGRFASSDEARRVLPSGTYIVRSNGKTIKVIF